MENNKETPEWTCTSCGVMFKNPKVKIDRVYNETYEHCPFCYSDEIKPSIYTVYTKEAALWLKEKCLGQYVSSVTIDNFYKQFALSVPDDNEIQRLLTYYKI